MQLWSLTSTHESNLQMKEAAKKFNSYIVKIKFDKIFFIQVIIYSAYLSMKQPSVRLFHNIIKMDNIRRVASFWAGKNFNKPCMFLSVSTNLISQTTGFNTKLTRHNHDLSPLGETVVRNTF